MEWDLIPFDQLVWGEKLGQGSFGVVCKGTYLGVEVAIKEVLPSTDYDMLKYFEREWRIAREARHPNIVQYLGLSKAPPPDGRIFIVLEFIDNGNLRSYIWDVRKHPTLPWRLRMSFATDIARAVAYLHARDCMHRDLKGENLLITANERIKMTDFGFARIKARNEDEMRRISMSPEILMGVDFELATDVFSLGIIFCEILSRRLVDGTTFKRELPSFGLDPQEVASLASPGCPPSFVSLALDCCAVDPLERPKMTDVLRRLRAIELDVLARAGGEGEHVGSLKLVGGNKRPAGKRIPSFGQGVGVDIRPSRIENHKKHLEGGPTPALTDDDDEEGELDDEDLKEILSSLGKNGGLSVVDGGTWRTARWSEATGPARVHRSDFTMYTDASEMRAHDHLLSETTTYAPSTASSSQTDLENTATVVRPRPSVALLPDHDRDVEKLDSTASVMTIKGTPSPPVVDEPQSATSPPEDQAPAKKVDTSVGGKVDASNSATPSSPTSPLSTVVSAPKLASPITSSPLPPSAFTHRFTIVKPIPSPEPRRPSASSQGILGWAFSAAGLSSTSLTTPVGGGKRDKSERKKTGLKCGVCRMKVKNLAPQMRCDDCSSVVHVKCSAQAPHNCNPSLPSTSSA